MQAGTVMFGSSSMETQPQQQKVYVHYNHADSCKHARWTAKESYQFMYARPWERVTEFYLDLVNDRLSLINLFGVDDGSPMTIHTHIWMDLTQKKMMKRIHLLHYLREVQNWKNYNHMTETRGKRYLVQFVAIHAMVEFSLGKISINHHSSMEVSIQGGGGIVESSEESKSVNVPVKGSQGTKSANVPMKGRSRRWARVTFKIVLSYHGGSFDGWQKQPGLNTVQGLVEKSLGRFVDETKAQLLQEKCLPIEGCAVVAGRTDKGVTAFQQVCSFYTWRTDVKCKEIEEAINSVAPDKVKVQFVSKVSREFHPNFSAKWRHYLYIFPLNSLDKTEREQSDGDTASFNGHAGQLTRKWGEDFEEDCEIVVGVDELDSRKKPRRFSVSRVNQLLQQLEGKSLSYKMFARDTKPSRSTGPPTMCFLHHARAVEARLPCSKANETGVEVMCVELVANRFLRKMVRVLVATAIREAAAGADCDALLKLMDTTCRRATAPPAPPDGLCLVEVGYQEFQQDNCLIF